MKKALKIFAIVILVSGNSFDGIAQHNNNQNQNKQQNNHQKKVQNKAHQKQSHPAHHVSRKTVVYKTPNRKVVAVRHIPNHSIRINHNGMGYYYDNHNFYRLNGGAYLPVFPGVGLRINSLPAGYRTVVINNRNFYTQNGVYYIQTNNYYEVVQPEIGLIVYELPAEAEKVTVNGMLLYEFNDVLYEKVQRNGTRAYEVVGYIDL